MLKLPLEKFCLDFNLKKLSLNSSGLKQFQGCRHVRVTNQRRLYNLVEYLRWNVFAAMCSRQLFFYYTSAAMHLREFSMRLLF